MVWERLVVITKALRVTESKRTQPCVYAVKRVQYYDQNYTFVKNIISLLANKTYEIKVILKYDLYFSLNKKDTEHIIFIANLKMACVTFVKSFSI